MTIQPGKENYIEHHPRAWTHDAQRQRLGQINGLQTTCCKEKNINPSLLNPPHKRPNPNTSHRMGMSADK